MPINLKLHSVKELRPPHGAQVVYIQSVAPFGMIAFEPAATTVDYCWFAVDEHGDFDGAQIIYEPDEPQPEGCVLEVMFGNQVVTDRDDVWWMLDDDYFAAFPEVD